MDNYIDTYSNTDPQFCQEGDLEDCQNCKLLGECAFWNDDECNIDIESEEFCWYEMSYYRFVDRVVSFRHSELGIE